MTPCSTNWSWTVDCTGGNGKWAQMAKNYFSLSRSRLGHMKLNANGVIVKELLLVFWTRKNCRDIVGNRPLCWLVEVENYWLSFTTTRRRGKEDSVWHAYSSWSMCPSISANFLVCEFVWIPTVDLINAMAHRWRCARPVRFLLSFCMGASFFSLKARDPWLSRRSRRTGMFLSYYMCWCFPVYVQVYRWRW